MRASNRHGLWGAIHRGTILHVVGLAIQFDAGAPHLFGAILLVQVVTIGLVIHMDCFQLRGLSKTRCTSQALRYF